ncbi:MAG: hypothetical protein ACK4MM_03655 [Fervidobacterium sp.]
MKNIDYIIIEGEKINLPINIGIKLDEQGEWKYNNLRCNIYVLQDHDVESNEYNEIVHIEKSPQFAFEKFEVKNDTLLY